MRRKKITFEKIFIEAIKIWPESVELSSSRSKDGTRLGFNYSIYENTIQEPYALSPKYKFIVQTMNWSIFGALPHDKFEGLYKLIQIDKKLVKFSFFSNVINNVCGLGSDLDSKDEDFLEFYYDNILPIHLKEYILRKHSKQF